MIKFTDIFLWMTYGAALFICILTLFAIVYKVFQDKNKNEVSAIPLLIFWILPVILVLGFLIQYALKYLTLLRLIR